MYETSPQKSEKLGAYTSLVSRYFSSKTYKLNELEKIKTNEDLVEFGKCLEEVFDWNNFNE